MFEQTPETKRTSSILKQLFNSKMCKYCIIKFYICISLAFYEYSGRQKYPKLMCYSLLQLIIEFNVIHNTIQTWWWCNGLK